MWHWKHWLALSNLIPTIDSIDVEPALLKSVSVAERMFRIHGAPPSIVARRMCTPLCQRSRLALSNLSVPKGCFAFMEHQLNKIAMFGDSEGYA